MNVNITYQIVGPHADLVPAQVTVPPLDPYDLSAIPHRGDIVLLAEDSAWIVEHRVLSRDGASDLRVQLFLRHFAEWAELQRGLTVLH